MTETSTPADPSAERLALQDQLSSLRGLLALATLMTRLGTEDQILDLAMSVVPSLGRFHAKGLYLDGRWSAVAAFPGHGQPTAPPPAQIAMLGPIGGLLDFPDESWTWAFPLSNSIGASRYLVVAGRNPPRDDEQFLLQMLAEQTGVALDNARLHARVREHAEELRTTNLALTRSVAIHERFTRVALSGEGQRGIVRAVYELTGYPAAIEDRHGNLVAWAGPDRPDPYPRDTRRRREQLLRRLLPKSSPVREQDRLIVLAQLGHDVVGVLSLIDPDASAGAFEQIALECARTVLTMELTRLHSVSETELRLQRDMVEALLDDSDEETGLHRAQTLGYDLGRAHRVIVVEGRARTGNPDAFFQAVRRAARDLGVGSITVPRSGAVIVLSDAEQPWNRFQNAVLAGLHGGSSRIGVGGQCRELSDFPRSYREARLALKVQKAASGKDQTITFDDLGVYQILGQVEDLASVERLVQRWLGPLLAYDAHHGSELVATVAQYLERGGNYAATAQALSVHRSTLKYRLQRIRSVSGHDLADPDTRFNLQLASRAWRTLEAIREP